MRIAKATEIIGASPESFEDAARRTLKRASKTIAGITGFTVLRRQVACLPGGKSEYRLRMRLIFELAPDFEEHE